jgi:hypothetical protein
LFKLLNQSLFRIIRIFFYKTHNCIWHDNCQIHIPGQIWELTLFSRGNNKKNQEEPHLNSPRSLYFPIQWKEIIWNRQRWLPDEYITGGRGSKLTVGLGYQIFMSKVSARDKWHHRRSILHREAIKKDRHWPNLRPPPPWNFAHLSWLRYTDRPVSPTPLPLVGQGLKFSIFYGIPKHMTLKIILFWSK